MNKSSFILIIGIFISVNLFSQANFSFKVIGFGASPFNDINRSLYTKNITNDSIFTFEPGVQLSAEIFGDDKTSVKLIQAYNKDQVGFDAGFTQVLLRFRIGTNKKTAFHIGIGPIVHYRKNWILIPNYQDEGYFNNSGTIQYKTFWLSGEAEFNYNMKRNLDFSVSINHLHRYSFGLFFGLKFWFKIKKSCSTCPSYN